ncbi:MAG: hypothetical protein K1W31_15810 [Lachnospiraceae bacterium]|jgi:drug/metabolite transporter (DMT)-like permease
MGMLKNNVILFLLMQIMNVIFSLNSVLMKLASISWQQEGLFAIKTVAILMAAVAVLGVYAVAWQAILSKVDLAQAYLNKGTVVFWGLVWSALVFREQITLFNIVGSVVIFIGLMMVNYHE